jgi:hypothetical protein
MTARAVALSARAGFLAQSGSSAISVSNTETISTAAAVLSPGTFSGRPCDPYAFRRVYPKRWSGFLRAHFQSAAHVGFFFSIDEHTARNWWHGKTGPQGWAVAYAVQTFPTARVWMEAA